MKSLFHREWSWLFSVWLLTAQCSWPSKKPPPRKSGKKEPPPGGGGFLFACFLAVSKPNDFDSWFGGVSVDTGRETWSPSVTLTWGSPQTQENATGSDYITFQDCIIYLFEHTLIFDHQDVWACGHAGFQATTKNHRKGTKKVQKLRHGPWTTPFETRRLFLLQLMSLFEYLWFMIDLWLYPILMRFRFIIQMFFCWFCSPNLTKKNSKTKVGNKSKPGCSILFHSNEQVKVLFHQ